MNPQSWPRYNQGIDCSPYFENSRSGWFLSHLAAGRTRPSEWPVSRDNPVARSEEAGEF